MVLVQSHPEGVGSPVVTPDFGSIINGDLVGPSQFFFGSGGDDNRFQFAVRLAADGPGVVQLDIGPVTGGVAVNRANPHRMREQKTVAETPALADSGRDAGQRSEPGMATD